MNAEEFTDRDERLGSILAECLEAAETGRSADRTALLERHPEFAAELQEFFSSYDRVPGLAPQLVSVAPLDSEGRADRPDSRRSWWDGQGQRLGDYELLHEIGRGGMAIVYEARQLSLRRRVALKVLPFAAMFDERHLQRFKNEAYAAALLHHPHIVPIYAVGCERGVHFYAMQFIDGQSLATVIEQLRGHPAALPAESPEIRGAARLSPARGGDSSGQAPEGANVPAEAGSFASTAPVSTIDVSAALTAGRSRESEEFHRHIARLMIQAAQALDHAHQHGVVHRDIKPANLLLTAAGHLWVTDFGLAQLQKETGLTRSGDLLGTFRYMSPEQTMGQRAVVDHRSDIYSLGATLYELLTLRPVFDGETRHALLYQILNHDPRAPRLVNRAIPVELETIVLKCLAKSPAERYRTAADLAADLQRYLDDQPIQARRPSLVDRARKWSRRHPSVVVSSVLLLAVVAVSLLISNRLIAREQAKLVLEQEKTAEALRREEQRANEADMQLQQARDAVELLLQISNREIADEPMARPGRVKLLEAALDYYQHLIERRGNLDASPPDLAVIRGRVQRALGELTALADEGYVLRWRLLVAMLASPAVLDDLELTAEQRAHVAQLRRHWSDESQRISHGLQEQDFLDRRGQKMFHLAKHCEELLAEMLSLQQRERLEQISYQASLISALYGPAVIRAIDLPPEVIADDRVGAMANIQLLPDSVGSIWATQVSGAAFDQPLFEVLQKMTVAVRKMAGRPFAPFYRLPVAPGAASPAAETQ
ncbi:MAG: protein kinase domain-containing protein [Planctomycetaceae bacterium]